MYSDHLNSNKHSREQLKEVAAAEQQPSSTYPKASTLSHMATSKIVTEETSTPITKSKRPSKIQLAATLRKIRHLLAEGYTNREIIEMLQLEERTFYRYMARIYEQDKAYFEKQDNEAIATEVRLAKERTLKSLRRYDAIATDETLSAAERMEAERCRVDTVIALVKLETEADECLLFSFFGGPMRLLNDLNPEQSILL